MVWVSVTCRDRVPVKVFESVASRESVDVGIGVAVTTLVFDVVRVGGGVTD
jgi:hypothetical protein